MAGKHKKCLVFEIDGKILNLKSIKLKTHFFSYYNTELFYMCDKFEKKSIAFS